LGHGTELKMEFKAAVSRSKVETQAVTFPVVAYIVNTLPAEFPVPRLTQATGSGTAVTLAPLNARNGATVSAQYTPMYTTDSIKVTMLGTAGAGSPAIAAKNGLTSGVVTFDIPTTAIAANIGNANKTFTLKYEVTRAGVVRSSKIVTVTVTPIPQAELLKTVIQINEANQTTRVLDLSTGTANRKLRVGSWPFIATNSPVWIEFKGFKSGGGAHNLKHWNGGAAYVNSTWFNQGWWESGISYASYLKELGDNTKLTLHFKAALGAGITEANAITFPVVEYKVKAEKVLELTNFNDGRDNGWKASGSTLITHGFGQGVGQGYSKFLQCRSGFSSALEKTFPANFFVPGRNYKIRISIRNSTVYALSFTLNVHHANGGRTWNSFFYGGSWESKVLAFPSLSSGSVRIEISLHGNLDATHFIDDITIIEV